MPKRSPDLRKLAKRQRWLIWLVLMGILSQFLPLFLLGQFGMIVVTILFLVHLVVYVLMIVGVVLLLVAQGSHVLVIILCGILMVAPCGNLLLLVLINMSVTRTLRRAGLKVGFLGVDPEGLERVLDPMLCTTCGYNLTGNVTGLCSECGTPISQNDNHAA